MYPTPPYVTLPADATDLFQERNNDGSVSWDPWPWSIASFLRIEFPLHIPRQCLHGLDNGIRARLDTSSLYQLMINKLRHQVKLSPSVTNADAGQSISDQKKVDSLPAPSTNDANPHEKGASSPRHVSVKADQVVRGCAYLAILLYLVISPGAFLPALWIPVV